MISAEFTQIQFAGIICNLRFHLLIVLPFVYVPVVKENITLSWHLTDTCAFKHLAKQNFQVTEDIPKNPERGSFHGPSVSNGMGSRDALWNSSLWGCESLQVIWIGETCCCCSPIHNRYGKNKEQLPSRHISHGSQDQLWLLWNGPRFRCILNLLDISPFWRTIWHFLKWKVSNYSLTETGHDQNDIFLFCPQPCREEQA